MSDHSEKDSIRMALYEIMHQSLQDMTNGIHRGPSAWYDGLKWVHERASKALGDLSIEIDGDTVRMSLDNWFELVDDPHLIHEIEKRRRDAQK